MTPTSEKIEKLLKATFTDAESMVVSCEGNHCSVSLSCHSFAGQSPVKRQQRVNACLKDLIASGEVHALRIDAKTPE